MRYGVEFVDPGSLQNKMPPRLLSAFNRRRAFRVTPDSSEPIEATIVRSQGGIRVELPVINVSASGVGLIARKNDDQLLMAGDEVLVSFSVPDVPGVLRMVGIVRYSQKQRGGVRYGVEFDREKTAMFKQQQKVVQTYVMNQQRKMLATD